MIAVLLIDWSNGDLRLSTFNQPDLLCSFVWSKDPKQNNAAVTEHKTESEPILIPSHDFLKNDIVHWKLCCRLYVVV